MEKNIFKSNGVESYSKASRQMARDGKKLMAKAIGMFIEQMGLDSLEDLEVNKLKLIADYIDFCNKAFDLIELQADAIEAQDKRFDALEDRLDKILKAVDKK